MQIQHTVTHSLRLFLWFVICLAFEWQVPYTRLITTLQLFWVSIFPSGSFNDFTLSQYSFNAESIFQVLHKAKGYQGLYERHISGFVKSINWGSNSCSIGVSPCNLKQVASSPGPQLHHGGNAGNNSTCSMGLLQRARELTCIKCLKECSTYNKHRISVRCCYCC